MSPNSISSDVEIGLTLELACESHRSTGTSTGTTPARLDKTTISVWAMNPDSVDNGTIRRA